MVAGAEPALVELLDGRPGEGGDVLAVVELAAGQAETVMLGGGVSITEALTLQTDAPVRGSIYFGAVD